MRITVVFSAIDTQFKMMISVNIVFDEQNGGGRLLRAFRPT
nr:MAG TPA_asm: hypothetical protein [Caudoviricetes sp.]